MSKNKKLAIVGSAPRHRNDAPYDDDSFEIWGLNFGYTYMKRVDRYFELHDLNKLQETNPEHVEQVKQIPCPVYLQKQYDGFVNPVIYPLQEVIDKTGSDYFTNSISYMIALAIVEGFKTIHIYGVDMAVPTEYGVQRPSCEYWIGKAQGKGVEVVLPDSSDLCKTTTLYAFGLQTGKTEELVNGRASELQSRIDEINNQLEMVKRNYEQITGEKTIERAMLQGGLAELDYNKQWGSE